MVQTSVSAFSSVSLIPDPPSSGWRTKSGRWTGPPDGSKHRRSRPRQCRSLRWTEAPSRNEEKRTEREAEPIGGRNLWNGDGAARLLQFGGSRVATNRLFVQSVNTNSPFTCEVSLFTNIPGRNNIPKHACPFQFVLIIYVRNHICIVHSKHSFFCFFSQGCSFQPPL